MGTDFVAPEWQHIQWKHGLSDFQRLWDHPLEWVDKINQRGSGWSGVGRLHLPRGDGGDSGFYVKKQQDYLRRTWRHPLRGESTCRIEFRNMRRYQRLGIPCPEPLYFAERSGNGVWRSLLVTEALNGFRALSEIRNDWRLSGSVPVMERNRMVDEVAELLRGLHRHSLCHHSLYPKHIFLDVTGSGRPARVIDLEKTNKPLLRRRAILRDLDSLHRRAYGWPTSCKIRFLNRYLGADRDDGPVRKLCAQLASRAAIDD